MNIKKKLAIFVSIVTIIISLSTVVFADVVYIPPEPIRDSIVEEF